MTQATTRRDLLRLGTSAAAYAAGAAIVTGGVALASEAKGASLPPLDRSAWEAASIALRRELERDALIDARHSQAVADGTITDELEQEWSDSIEPLSDAEWALFDAPAPDHSAMEWKLTFLRDRDITLEPNVYDRLMADLGLLCGEAR